MKITPDRWKILEITSPEGEVYHKVFGAWSGGYLHGDSWKMNSGIKSVYKQDEYFVVMGYSGSAYLCHEDGEGVTGYGSGILSGFLEHEEVKLVDDGVQFLKKAAGITNDD